MTRTPNDGRSTWGGAFVVRRCKRCESMKYVSTRGQVAPIDFQDAVLMGLADDGGLIIPESIPDVSDRLDAWADLSYRDLAFEVLRLFVADIPESDLTALIDATYGEAFDPEVAPTVKVGPFHVMELWRGPTMSFKDVALQLLGNLFEYILDRREGARGIAASGRMNILCATSGDTGGAAIYGCRGRKGIHIFIMHPRGRVSPIQERQMTAVLDDNVHNIAVEGSFDDCQNIMKSIASDLDFKRTYSLGAVNSVNWARVLAQIVYYFKGAFDVRRRTGAERVRVCVPTGNFGNILAGWYAVRMGAPISQLILATNENDILPRFFNTGVYSLGEVHHTLAPAMDIQVASNFERYLYYRVGCDPERLRGLMEQFVQTGSLRIDVALGSPVDDVIEGGSVDTEEMLSAIRRCHELYGYILDPHTACGFAVAEARVPVPVGTEGEAVGADEPPVLCLSTAHPAKFPEAIRRATGKDVAQHPAIDALTDLPTRCETLPNNENAVRRFIIETVG